VKNRALQSKRTLLLSISFVIIFLDNTNLSDFCENVNHSSYGLRVSKIVNLSENARTIHLGGQGSTAKLPA